MRGREEERENENGKERIKTFVSIVSSFLPLPLIMGLFVALWFLLCVGKQTHHPLTQQHLRLSRARGASLSIKSHLSF